MVQRFTKIVNIVVLTLLLSVSTLAQDGTVDTNFGTNGHVMTQILVGEDLKNSGATNVLVLKDGKILAVGSYDNFGTPAIAVVRYNPNGSLDETFGDGGIVRTFFANTQVEGTAGAIALQSDGKIVISGSSTNTMNFDLALARLTYDGKVDSSFGNNGAILIPVGENHDYSSDMVIQDDDKIILVGSTSDINGTDAVLARFLPDGELDTSFGTDGIIIEDFEGGADVFNTVELQSNGKIVAGGYSSYVGFSLAIARYNSDGSLDTSLDQDGKLLIDGLAGWVVSITLLNQNGMLVLGAEGGEKIKLAKLNADGSLVTSFGNNGTLETNFVGSTNDDPKKLLVQNDNKFIVVGTTWQSGPWVMSGQRFNEDGTVDNSFATNGAFFIDLNGQDFSRANGATMAPDGSIFIAGRTLTDKRVGIFSVLKINNNSTPLVGVENDESLINDYQLSQNYPNPFNPTTTIKYQVAKHEMVTLKVYNALGEQVTTLVNELKAPGAHEVKLNGSDLTSGVYFYQLTAGNFTETKKMMLIK